jgi:hypothetical protein
LKVRTEIGKLKTENGKKHKGAARAAPFLLGTPRMLDSLEVQVLFTT